MDHAEAHERLADLALEPRRLLDIEADPTPEDRALLAHAEECSTCRAELSDWRRTHQAVLAAAASGGIDPGGRLPAVDSSAEPPASLRGAVAAIPRRSPRLLDPAGGRPPSPAAATAPEMGTGLAGRGSRHRHRPLRRARCHRRRPDEPSRCRAPAGPRARRPLDQPRSGPSRQRPHGRRPRRPRRCSRRYSRLVVE